MDNPIPIKGIKAYKFSQLDLESVVSPWLDGDLDLRVLRLPERESPGYLRRIREENNLSARALGNELDISGVQISRLESTPPTRNPTPAFVSSWASVMRLDPREVLDNLGFVCLLNDEDAAVLHDETNRFFEGWMLHPALRAPNTTAKDLSYFSLVHRRLVVDVLKSAAVYARKFGRLPELDEQR